MAILKSGPMGNITGKIHNVVVRHVNGKSVISLRPKKYKKTKSEKAKQVRGRFSIAVEFSRYINAIPELKAVWTAANKECASAFNMIEKYNIRLVDDRSPSLKNVITPVDYPVSHECVFLFSEILFDGNLLAGKINPRFNPAQLQNSEEYSLVFVFSFTNPKNEGTKYFDLDAAVYTNPSLDQESESYQLPLPAEITGKSALYNSVIIYAAAVAKGEKPGQLFSSLTRSKEFRLS